MKNIDRLKDFVSRWSTDPEGACRDHVAADFECHEPPALPQGGVFRGQDAPARISAIYRSIWDVDFRDLRFLETEDPEVVVGCYQTCWTSKTTRRSLTQPIIELFFFRDGKLGKMEVFHFDPNGLLETLIPSKAERTERKSR